MEQFLCTLLFPTAEFENQYIHVLRFQNSKYISVLLNLELRWPTLISVAQRSAHCRHSTL